MNLVRGAGFVVAAGVMLAPVPLAAQGIPALPDSTGFGVHVLALARATDSAIWVGTYGDGIYVLRKNAAAWEHITRSRDTSAHSISFDFVHAFGFGPKGQVWYGTVGNGWGVSSDNGKTWRNWEFTQLGPEWQYVAPNGIATLGDTTYIATADGIKVTGDDGNTWSVITDSAGATTSKDPVIGRIPNQYVLAIASQGPEPLAQWRPHVARRLRAAAVPGAGVRQSGAGTAGRFEESVLGGDGAGRVSVWAGVRGVENSRHTWLSRSRSRWGLRLSESLGRCNRSNRSRFRTGLRGHRAWPRAGERALGLLCA